VNQYNRTYAPPDVEQLPYPAAIEQEQPPPKDTETQAALIVATVANICMAVVIITMLLHDGQVRQTIIAGYLLPSEYRHVRFHHYRQLDGHRQSPPKPTHGAAPHRCLSGAWLNDVGMEDDAGDDANRA
jgi:hypothetical protein